jgi:hypothetical protein
MKFQKRKLINIATTGKKHDEAKGYAKEKGMTLSGMIKYAVKKVFNIDL